MSQQPAGAVRFTLGVVIPVPEPHESFLRAWRKKFGGVSTQDVAPHITLVSGSYSNSWEQAVAQVRAVAAVTPSFSVRLAGVDSFRPASEVVYLPLVEGAERCVQLHDALLADQLCDESSFGYHPHLTIAQNVPAADLDAAQAALSGIELDFEVSAVQLFDTRGGQWNLSEELLLGRA